MTNLRSDNSEHFQITRPSRLSLSGNLPSLSTIISYAFILFLIYAFISGLTMQFYASILFFFYSIVKRMWISVIMLGVFQTILLIPFRIIKLYKANHIKEFVEKVEEIKNNKEQEYQFRQHTKKGTRTVLFYSVDFFVQLVSYTSIGRLFLTDFYSKNLDSKYLYDFVKYPQYPIEGRFFKIPYPYFTQNIDLGLKWVLIAWLAIFILLLLFRLAKYIFDKNQNAAQEQTDKIKGVYKAFSGQLLLFCILAWIIIRNFPIAWKLGIFIGDVAIPNIRLNTITAIVTFATLFWFGINNIKHKSKIAKNAGFDDEIIAKTEQEMLKTSFFNSLLIGLGAFFITNQIPSAFELSIFTLEIISLLSPLTLDKLILTPKINQSVNSKTEENKA